MDENIQYSSSSSSSEEDPEELDDVRRRPTSSEDDVFDYIDPDLYTGLMKDVLFNRIDEASKKIREGKSVRVVDNVGNSLLHLGVASFKGGNFDMINFLLEQEDLDINAPNYIQRTPLLESIKRKETKLAIHLIERGAKIDFPKETPPLHEACKYGLEEVAKCIIERGADVNSLDRDGDTPLHVAVYHKRTEMVYLLLYYGAEMLENEASLTPTDLAMQSKAMRLFSDLCEYTVKSSNVKINMGLYNRHRNFDQEVERIIADREEDDIDFYPRLSEWCILQRKPKAMELLLNNYVLQVSLSKLILRGFKCHKMNWMMFKRNLEIIMRLKEERLMELTDEKHGIFLSLIIVGYCSLKQKIDISDRDFLHEVSSVLLSYGLEVWETDLDVVYQLFGFCDFFDMLLQMEVKPSSNMPKYNMIPYLMVDVDYTTPFWEKFHNLKKDFRNSIAKCYDRKAWRSYTREHADLPKLSDLSRNIARHHICRRYRFKKSHQFYYWLRHACLPSDVKKLLAFNIPLYGKQERSNSKLQLRKWRLMQTFILQYHMTPFEKP